MIQLGSERRSVGHAAFAVGDETIMATRFPMPKMLTAKMQTATVFAAERFAATNVTQASVDHLVAARMIAISWNAVAYVSAPIVVVTK